MKTYEYEFIVFADTAETVCPAIAAEVIKRHRRDKGGMALTARDDALFPRREYCQEIILPTSQNEPAIR